MSGQHSSVQFVGRHAELEALQDGSEAYLISGEAGVGKSCLVAELQRRAEAAGKRVLIGECVPLSAGELAYAPIVAALRPVLAEAGRLKDLPAADRTELALLWPELDPGAMYSTREAGQARLFTLLLGLLTRIGQERPLILVVEDLQWADRSTCDFLAVLVRFARDAPVSLIATVRTEELSRQDMLRSFVADLTRLRGVRRLDLAPFTLEELTEQAWGLVGAQPPPGLVNHLFQRTGGNAFYSEELLKAGDASELPASLRDAVMVGIERLSASARRLVAVAAIAQRAVDERLLTAAGALGEEESARGLREALGQRVLVATGGGAYGFRHELVREVVAGELLASERRRLHRELAQTLARQPELAAPGIGVAGELAYHWHAAGEPAMSFEASVTASADAERALAFAEALAHCERALELWEHVPDAARRAELDRAALLSRAALCALRSDHPRRAVQLGRLAIEELRGRKPAELVPVHMIIGRALFYLGDSEGTLAAYHAAVQLTPPSPPTRERALALAGQAQALMLDGQVSESAPRCQEALGIARGLGDRLVEAQALNTLSALGWSVGNPVEHAAAARSIAREIGADAELGRGYVTGSEALDYAGRVKDAAALAQEGLATVEPLGLRDLTVDLTSRLAALRLRLGQLEEATLLCAEETPRASHAAVWRYLTIGQLAIARRALDQADDALSHAEEIARAIGGPEWLPPVWVAVATLRLWQARLQDAASVIQRALDAVAHPRSPWLGDFADIYPLAARIAADQAQQARDRGMEDDRHAYGAKDAVARLDARLGLLPSSHPPARPVACRALASAEATRAAGRSDADAWKRAAEGFRRLHEPYTVAYAEYRQAEALLASAGDGRTPLRDAHAITTSLGEKPLRLEIEALGQRARIAFEDAPAADPANELGITVREREVLALLSEGRTNREIAEALVITEKTASVHVSHILAKLDARNRGQAAAIAHRLGLASS